jgi:hypothetical protein
MTTSEYNMHGVAAVIEFSVPQARVQRNTLGTALIQPANTENWLHLPVQTPKEVRQSMQAVHYIRLTARTNENARIDILRLSDKNGILYQFAVNCRGCLHCDALVVAKSGVAVIPLRRITLQSVVEHAGRYLRALQEYEESEPTVRASRGAIAALEQTLTSTLAWLWDDIVEPAMQGLGYTGTPAAGDDWLESGGARPDRSLFCRYTQPVGTIHPQLLTVQLWIESYLRTCPPSGHYSRRAHQAEPNTCPIRIVS